MKCSFSSIRQTFKFHHTTRYMVFCNNNQHTWACTVFVYVHACLYVMHNYTVAANMDHLITTCHMVDPH